MKLIEINTSLSAEEFFLRIQSKKGVFFLDSSDLDFDAGKYHFLGFDPFLTFQSKNETTIIKTNCYTETIKGNALESLRKILRQYSSKANTSEIPFVGGGVGFFSYDLAHNIEKLPRRAQDDLSVQDIYFGFYNNVIIYDKKNSKVFISDCGYIKSNKIVEEIRGILLNNKYTINNIKSQKEPAGDLISNFTRQSFIDSVKKIKNYILNGDIYQANLTQRFQCNVNISPVDLYVELRNNNPAPFAGYYDFEDGKVLSSSPERFLRIKDRSIETKPIKGTIQRGATPNEDKINKEILINSEKDKSELLMIVDLERNDIGRVSLPGSVRVPELFKLEKYATVYHLVSTITGSLKENMDVIDCLQATFPGGSITGAPKIRSMEIIDEIEPTQRNIYTGSLGYIGFDGTTDLNILIRTILYKNATAYFQVGGGITWDSDPELEYMETLHKGKALFKTLNANEFVSQNQL